MLHAKFLNGQHLKLAQLCRKTAELATLQYTR